MPFDPAAIVHSVVKFHPILTILQRRWQLWAAPLAAMTLLSFTYVAIRPASGRRLAARIDPLQNRLNEQRHEEAQREVVRGEQSQRLAQADFDAAQQKLDELEGQAAQELRTAGPAGGSENTQQANLERTKGELRQAEALRSASLEQLKYLTPARQDPVQIAAMPDRLLAAQPALLRLRTAFAAARQRTAELLSSRSAEHPQVLASRATEDLLKQDLRREIDAAMDGLYAELRSNKSRIDALENETADAEKRLALLALWETRRANLRADLKQRAATLEGSNQKLADARASAAATATASLGTRFDAPSAADEPPPMPGAAIILLGIGGGLLAGLGLVYLANTLETGRVTRLPVEVAASAAPPTMDFSTTIASAAPPGVEELSADDVFPTISESAASLTDDLASRLAEDLARESAPAVELDLLITATPALDAVANVVPEIPETAPANIASPSEAAAPAPPEALPPPTPDIAQEPIATPISRFVRPKRRVTFLTVAPARETQPIVSEPAATPPLAETERVETKPAEAKFADSKRWLGEMPQQVLTLDVGEPFAAVESPTDSEEARATLTLAKSLGRLTGSRPRAGRAARETAPPQAELACCVE